MTYSLFIGSGHAVEIMTVDRKLTIFRGLLKRDLVVSLIVEQGNTMRPRHLMLVLFQGEPEELNKTCVPIKGSRDSIQLGGDSHNHHFTNIRGSTNSTYVEPVSAANNSSDKNKKNNTNNNNNNNSNSPNASSAKRSPELSSSDSRRKSSGLSSYITPQACAIKGFSTIQRSSRSSSSPIMPQFLKPPQPKSSSTSLTSLKKKK